MKERATFVDDMLVEGKYLLEEPTEYDEQTVSKKWKENSAMLMQEWISRLETITEFNASNIETLFKSFLEEKQMGIGAVLPLFRLLVTGAGMGPSMFEIAAFIGKENCLSRMRKGIEILK
jgi:glutamyl-tRNA synthetase